MRDDFKSSLLMAILSAFVAALFSSILVVGALAAEAEPPSQVKLTERDIEGVIAAQPEIEAYASKVEDVGNGPTAADDAALDKIAKSHGFTSYDALEAATFTAAFILEGVDMDSGAFTEPRKVLERELADVKSDKELDEEERKLLIEELTTALEADPKVTYPEDIPLVVKHRKKLSEVLQ